MLRSTAPSFIIVLVAIRCMLPFMRMVPLTTAFLNANKRIYCLPFLQRQKLLAPQPRPYNYHHCPFPVKQCYNNFHYVFRRFSSANDNNVSENEVSQRRSSNKFRDEHSLESVEKVINKIANRSRSWERLRPLVELAIKIPKGDALDCSKLESSTTKPSKTIVDIGCDHGLLAVGLAVSGQFTNVIGIDVSLDALQDGAYKLYNSIVQRQLEKNSSVDSKESIGIVENNNNKLRLSDTEIEFRHGNGLLGLRSDEMADTICIAGMGTNTMIDILTTTNPNDEYKKSSLSSSSSSLLHKLNCTQIILQPTNSKPKDLLVLYKTIINNLGFQLVDERIVYVSKRWYVSSSFILPHYDDDIGTTDPIAPFPAVTLPGSILAKRNNPKNATTWEIFQKWVTHHEQWIRSDHEKTGLPISIDELEWIQAFCPILKQ